MKGKRITLDLELGAERIAGLISSPERAAERFSGYVELIAALEAVRTTPVTGLEADGTERKGAGGEPGAIH